MRLMISGGGTGGHIYPALALIQRLKERDMLDAVMYVGTARGLESRIVPNAKIPFETLELQGFKRSLNFNGIKTNIRTVEKFVGSLRKATRMIKDFKPDVVVGTGGYVSAGVLYAAARHHVPTVIHEQNSVAGVTNKFLAHAVDKIAITFPVVASAFPAKKVVITGNPRAQQVAGLKPNDRLADFGLDPHKRTLLIFGGSRGAPMINQAAVNALPTFGKAAFQTLFVTGNANYGKISHQLRQVPANVKVVPYVDDMPQILPDVSLVIGRSGATSLAELTALGLPSVLIPSPNVTHNHQFVNAKSLADVGAAIVITEPELDSSFAGRIVDLMEDDTRLTRMAQAAKKMGTPDAADQLITVLESVLKH
ncbi:MULTISPECIES: undecaprenyldiphospho-muramoylpentapeptide beta-N-acetylglucosaminyltransferase [unclassified Lacticaseibacillus]|uniref:undecaprenyldiphospho-muramoylpentapeptide beta-N-acetylglucosaminyltransferase n=1 Tax=unclassified Lacticaseibacillus TaxID=2759744 RepID=UPI00194496FE|nr:MULTISPECIES: undecaprenyldiphospho-muramoylpentapeptide beta-N-acetylglucosaminyltransferase [unclassified Lacticaseibacillus]